MNSARKRRWAVVTTSIAGVALAAGLLVKYVVTLNQSFYACGVDVLSASPGCSTLLGSPPPARPPTSFQGS